MFDHKVIVKKIDEVLHLTEDVLGKAQAENLSVYNHCGEWTIGFEILCDNLYESKSPISQQVYDLIKDIGISLNVDKKEWEILKPQIPSANS